MCLFKLTHLYTPVVCYVNIMGSTFCKGGALHSAAQVLLLLSNWCSCDVHAQCLHRLNSKVTCAHLCADGSVGLKRRWGRARFWHNAILGTWKCLRYWPPKITSGVMSSCYLQGALLFVYTAAFTRCVHSAWDTRGRTATLLPAGRAWNISLGRQPGGDQEASLPDLNLSQMTKLWKFDYRHL